MKLLARGLDDLVLDALRAVPHPMHQTVEQALDLCAELRPRRAWFTHIAHGTGIRKPMRGSSPGVPNVLSRRWAAF